MSEQFFNGTSAQELKIGNTVPILTLSENSNRPNRWTEDLTEGDIRVADLLGQMFTIDTIEPVGWVNSVHTTHSSDTAEIIASLIYRT